MPATAQTVTLAEAHERMVTGGLDFEILEAELQASGELVRQALGQRRPRVALRFDYEQVTQKIVSSDNTAYEVGTSQYPRTTMRLEVRQPLFDQARWRELGVARAEQELAEAEAELSRNQIVREMIGAFLDVAQAQYEVDKAQAVIDARTQLERNLSDLIAAGRENADALTRAESETFAARVTRSDAEMLVIEALSSLQRYAGPEITGVALGANRIGTVDLDSLAGTLTRERLLELSPDIQIAQAERTLAEKRVSRARAAARPVAELALDVEQEETDGSLFGGGSNTQTTTLGVNLTIPLYEGGVNRSRVREAQARQKAAELRLTQTQDVVLRRHDALMQAAAMAGTRAGTLAAQLSVQEKAVTAAEAQVASGRVAMDMLLEQQVRRDVLRIELQAARLRVLQVQTELFALFGALDVQALSGQISG